MLALVIPVASASQNIQVVSWNTDNSSCNGLLNITNTTVTDTWNVTLTNVTDGIEYRIYNSTEYMLDSSIASTGSAILEFTGIEDGLYKIVELSNPRLKWTYWHPENSNPTGIVEVSQSSGYNYINFTISNPTLGATYHLYNPTTTTLHGNGNSFINVTGIVDGTYNIIKTGVGESITVDSWNRSNASAIGVFTLHNSTIFSNWTFVVQDAVPLTTYSLHTLNGTATIASAITVGNAATITAIGLSDSTQYRISERGPEEIHFTQWNSSNVSAIGIFDIINSTPASVWNFTLHSDGTGDDYVLYTMPSHTIVSRTNVTGTSTLLSVTNLSDDTYYIAKTGTERFILSTWNPASDYIVGIFTLSNSTPFSNMSMLLTNVTGGSRYVVIDSSTNATLSSAYASHGEALLTMNAILDGTYWILKETSNSQMTDPSFTNIVFFGGFFVLAAAAFINRRRTRP